MTTFTQTRDPFAQYRTARSLGLSSAELPTKPERGDTVKHKKKRPSHERIGGRMASKKKLSGSKQAKKYGGFSCWQDHIGAGRDMVGRSNTGTYRRSPNHTARYNNLADCWPLLRVGH